MPIVRRLLSIFTLMLAASATSAQTVQRPILLSADAVESIGVFTFGTERAVWALVAARGTSVDEPRQIQFRDLALLTLGGVGGGLAAGAIAVAADPPVAARVAVYGLGVAVGTTLSGRLFDIGGSPVGALVGAAAGSGIVLLIAQAGDDGEEDLSDAATVALLALVVPPVLSTGGFVVAPAVMRSGSLGLALRVKLQDGYSRSRAR